MKRDKYMRYCFLLMALPASVGIISCNKDSDSPEDNPTTTILAVNSFSIENNSVASAGLDSVFFSIDLEHGVIFNADSLPKGTDVSALVAKITYSSSVSKAVIEMTGGNKRQGTIEYSSTPTDTIDFTGNVSLTLTSGDYEKSYKIKLNIHQSNPDSLVWDKMAVAPLPSRSANPRVQKTLKTDTGIFSLIEESDGSLTLSSCKDAGENSWSKEELTPGFSPQIRTFSYCNKKFYILADDGKLMTSEDASNWIETGKRWHNIIGEFGATLLGIEFSDGRYYHASYPSEASERRIELGETFPIDGFSNLGSFKSQWSADPTAFIVGGIDSRGNYVDKTWAFDGSRWAEISNRTLPAMRNIAICPYYAYRTTKYNQMKEIEYSVWLAIGGAKEDGSINHTIYVTYDNGVNWDKAPTSMQLPDFLPGVEQADLLIEDFDKTADYADNWKKLPTKRMVGRRVSYTLDDTTISWECPYIYLYGGLKSDGKLNENIWRGVLARLTFAPLF